MNQNILFVVNSVAVDWLTVTSFGYNARRRFEAAMDDVMFRTKTGKVMQYVGQMYASGFCGQAEQGGRIHTMARVTGQLANEAFERVVTYAPSSTRYNRIDLQVTVSLPDSYKARSLADYMKINGGRCKVSLIENGGLDTVYIGARTSPKFWRIYIKEDSESKRWLRFEIELKH